MPDPAEIVARYGTEAWRYLGWTDAGLARIRQWEARAVAAGLSPTEAEALWAGVELDQMLSERPFNAVREADRRLLVWMTESR
ncbi:MAG TPA: hypothetical protein VFU40_07055 [Gemmatimonadales bacterium]|nr:hypothetical protein [Gemmatimonadales bacterium]